MSAPNCLTCVPAPLRALCAPQLRRYADGLRAALAFCDRVAGNYDDIEQVDELRWYLRRALVECGACEPSVAEADEARS